MPVDTERGPVLQGLRRFVIVGRRGAHMDVDVATRDD